MKKLTLSVAFLLLGGIYMANAQVGIGTPNPNSAAQLDIVATNKGVLIPRVELIETTDFNPIAGTATESLLVYNTKAQNDVVVGFYYWSANKWNRIVNTSDLDATMGNLAEIKKLISYIVPSSPVNNPSVPQTHTSMVYNPTTKEMFYVTYNTATNSYKTDLIDLAALVAGAETKTFIRTITAVGGNIQHIYFSEEAIQNWIAAAPTTNNISNIPDNFSGGVTIDAGADVVQNFQNIINQSTTYGAGQMTIKNIIKEIAGVADGNVIYKNIGTAPAVEWVFQYWDGAAYVTISLGGLVQANESKTRILKTGTPQTEITYNYAHENNKPDAAGVATVGSPDVINVTGDMINSITLNENVRNAIKNVLNGGGNVFYTATEILVAANPDGLAIPAKSLYTIDAAGVKVLIDISGVVLNVITNNAGDIKTILGNKYNLTTHYKTGDTWIDGKAVYAFKSTTTITANSAVASIITLPVAAGNVVSIKLYKAGNLVTSATTDVLLTGGTGLGFNIGTGNMYNILPAGLYDVVVEFSAD
ncbi:hypothetical protein [Flavobacterium sp. JP2137]|uniref:hypothetical protein n=1 Tax=Flavobacterium sp. JP2137 TaxID=3414510 RepID=UPI003D2FD896